MAVKKKQSLSSKEVLERRIPMYVLVYTGSQKQNDMIFGVGGG
jgi:hypothetical protein